MVSFFVLLLFSSCLDSKGWKDSYMVCFFVLKRKGERRLIIRLISANRLATRYTLGTFLICSMAKHFLSQNWVKTDYSGSSFVCSALQVQLDCLNYSFNSSRKTAPVIVPHQAVTHLVSVEMINISVKSNWLSCAIIFPYYLNCIFVYPFASSFLRC